MSGSELEALRFIAEARRERGMAIATLGRRMAITTNYARLLCASLGREGYIMFSPVGGRCRITAKGKDALTRGPS